MIGRAFVCQSGVCHAVDVGEAAAGQAVGGGVAEDDAAAAGAGHAIPDLQVDVVDRGGGRRPGLVGVEGDRADVPAARRYGEVVGDTVVGRDLVAEAEDVEAESCLHGAGVGAAGAATGMGGQRAVVKEDGCRVSGPRRGACGAVQDELEVARRGQLPLPTDSAAALGAAAERLRPTVPSRPTGPGWREGRGMTCAASSNAPYRFIKSVLRRASTPVFLTNAVTQTSWDGVCPSVTGPSCGVCLLSRKPVLPLTQLESHLQTYLSSLAVRSQVSISNRVTCWHWLGAIALLLLRSARALRSAQRRRTWGSGRGLCVGHPGRCRSCLASGKRLAAMAKAEKVPLFYATRSSVQARISHRGYRKSVGSSGVILGGSNLEPAATACSRVVIPLAVLRPLLVPHRTAIHGSHSLRVTYPDSFALDPRWGTKTPHFTSKLWVFLPVDRQCCIGCLTVAELPNVH